MAGANHFDSMQSVIQVTELKLTNNNNNNHSSKKWHLYIVLILFKQTEIPMNYSINIAMIHNSWPIFSPGIINYDWIIIHDWFNLIWFIIMAAMGGGGGKIFKCLVHSSSSSSCVSFCCCSRLSNLHKCKLPSDHIRPILDRGKSQIS